MSEIFIHLERTPIEPEILKQSPVFRLACIVMDLAAQRGPIPLTKKLAFKRDFVSETFDLLSFKNCDAELFGPQTVRDQRTFGLLEILHDVLIDLELADHIGRQFVLTDAGRSLRARDFELCYSIFPHFLFRVNHTYYHNIEDRLDRDWLNIFGRIHRLSGEISFKDLCLEISGQDVRLDRRRDPVRDELDIGIIRPLYWSGILEQTFVKTGRGYEYRYNKTALWYRVFVRSWLDELARAC